MPKPAKPQAAGITEHRRSVARRPKLKYTTNGRLKITMDALTLLKADHEAVETKFARFEALGPRALKSKAAVVAYVIEALSVHAAIEEQVLYPALRDRLADEEGQVLEALEEHHVVKWTMSELDGMSPDHERFDAKFTVLIENVRHHVKEEESELFPQVRQAFTRTELADLGDALMQAKTTAPTKPHPRSPDEPPMNEVAAAATNPFDTLRTAGEAMRRALGIAIPGCSDTSRPRATAPSTN